MGPRVVTATGGDGPTAPSPRVHIRTRIRATAQLFLGGRRNLGVQVVGGVVVGGGVVVVPPVVVPDPAVPLIS